MRDRDRDREWGEGEGPGRPWVEGRGARPQPPPRQPERQRGEGQDDYAARLAAWQRQVEVWNRRVLGTSPAEPQRADADKVRTMVADLLARRPK